MSGSDILVADEGEEKLFRAVTKAAFRTMAGVLPRGPMYRPPEFEDWVRCGPQVASALFLRLLKAGFTIRVFRPAHYDRELH
jgi:hypothetical protein